MTSDGRNLLQPASIRIWNAEVPRSWFSQQSLIVGLSAIPGSVIFLLSFFQLAQFNDTCIVHRLTGFWCPLCGGTRALRELVHGHFASAVAYNPFALVTVAAMGFLLMRFLNGFRSGKVRSLITVNEAVVYAIVAVLFGIVRNLPGMWIYINPLLGPAG